MSIQQRLLRLCEDAGFARHGAGKRLSKIANVSVKTGNKWLNGSTSPTLQSLIPLAMFFGVRAEWLMHGEGNPYLIEKPVNVHSLLSDEVVKTGACSKLVVCHLRIIALAALNGELIQCDADALSRIVERVQKKKAA